MKLRIRRRAEVGWRGTVEQGSGRVSLGSGAFAGSYSLKSRVDEEPTTNPEELIGAGHAACFTMSVADLLSERGTPPVDLTTVATVLLEEGDTGFSVSRITLDLTGVVPEVTEETFAALAEQAKRTCPISRALAGTEIELVTRLAAADATAERAS